MTQRDLFDFMSCTYAPENIVVCVSGDVDADAVTQDVSRSWEDAARSRMQKEDSPEEAADHGFRYHRMTGDIQQKLLVMGAPASSVLSDDAAALVVLDAVLSDGRSSRLYRAAKEQRRLANKRTGRHG
jgi:zinc protease